MERWAAASIAAALGSGAACAADVSWDAQGAASVVVTVAPSDAQQLCTRLRSGQRVVWAFVSQSSVDFNLHHPQGKGLNYLVQKSAVREARDALEPAVAQEYCWVWTNRTEAPAQISVQMRRR